MATIKYKIMREFSSANVGDILVVEHGAGSIARIRTAKVMRITKTQLICKNAHGQDERYRIKDGKEVNAEGGKFGWIHTSYARGIKIN